MNLIGLTGGIATGKTTVSNYFSKLNITVIDADIINQQLLQPNNIGYHEILRTFPDIALLQDGSLNKAHLRNKIFNDANSKTILEKILHPLIKAEINLQITQLQAQPAPYCIISVPLMIEANFTHLVSKLWVCDCSEEHQLNRLMHRDNISKVDAKLIMSHQLSRQERLQYADEIISTNDQMQMKKRVKYLHQQQILLNSK